MNCILVCIKRSFSLLFSLSLSLSFVFWLNISLKRVAMYPYIRIKNNVIHDKLLCYFFILIVLSEPTPCCKVHRSYIFCWKDSTTYRENRKHDNCDHVNILSTGPIRILLIYHTQTIVVYIYIADQFWVVF